MPFRSWLIIFTEPTHMSTKQLQHWFDQHTAFRDRGLRFRIFTTMLFAFHLLAILVIWFERVF